MKALVTGGAGFIGRWVVKRLLDEGVAVLVLDDLSNGRKENLADFEGRTGYLGLVTGDVKDRLLLRSLFSDNVFDSVYHLAASIQVQSSIDDPELTFRNDVEGTFAILEACRSQYFRLNGLQVEDKRFHLDEVKDALSDFRPKVAVMSTCMVYSRATDNRGISEEHPLWPASPYAASKIAADNLALSYFHSYQMPVTVVRPFNTYGPFQKSNMEGGVVSIFVKRDIERKSLLIKGDGLQTRDLLFVEDCADFVVSAAECDGARGETLNAGSGSDVSIQDLAAMVATSGNVTEHIAHDHPQAEIPRLLCDSTKAARLLNWSPKTDLPEGLSRTRAWLTENRWAW
ncbi:MAG: dTDP-glucose 4,6-dehydratase [Blastocatellia bacterium]